MIRDPGPIHSLGAGVTTRDVPLNEGETSGVAPNSGYVSRALNEHPIMRFFATTAATITATVVASMVTKKGGVKLAKFAQDSARNGAADSFSTRMVNSALQVRRELDELEGFKRSIGDGGEDPYTNLVFDIDGKLGTGYTNSGRDRFGYGYDSLNANERRASRITGESNSPAAWTMKDNIQQRLVRAGRRMPYELPAMYGVQKSIIEPLMGDDESRKKVNWYNPLDVITDFTTQSITNMATMILPFEFAGAAATAGRSSLHTLKYSQADLRRLTGFQQKMHKGFFDVSEVLSEVGHDFAKLTDRFLRGAAQSSGALSAATEAYKNNQQGFVQNLHSLRHGRDQALKNAQSQNMSAARTQFEGFKSLFTNKNNSKSVLDLVPSLRGVRAATIEGASEFKKIGLAYDASKSPIAFNNLRNSINSGGHKYFNDIDELNKRISTIRSAHDSNFARLATDLSDLGVGTVPVNGVPIGSFSNGIRQDAFKDLIEANLIKSGQVTPTAARSFRDNLGVIVPKDFGRDPTLITKMGKTRIYGAGTTPAEMSDDFFDQVIKRFRGASGSAGFNADKNVLRSSIEEAQSKFLSTQYQKELNSQIAKSWNKVDRDSLGTLASSVLKPQKQGYRDFMDLNNLTSAKKQFLQRKTAETLGIRLTKDNGKLVSDKIVQNSLRSEGFDPNNFGELRGFLMRRRQLSSTLSDSGFNLFGLRAVTVDEARSSGIFESLSDKQKNAINIIAKRMASNDPVSQAIGASKVSGLYSTANGRMIDTTMLTGSVKRFGNFLSSEFQVPILGFNPAELAGSRSFSEMARKRSVQYISNRDVQPFLPAGSKARADFYLYTRNKGTKGKLLEFTTDELTGKTQSTMMKGSYRAFSSDSMDLFSRHARFASGNFGQTTDQIRGKSGIRLLDRALRSEERGLRFKSFMNIDPEQPNSLFRYAQRLRNRKTDLNNPKVMARILRDNDAVDFSDPNSVSSFLGAYDDLRQLAFSYGTPSRVMQAVEEANPDLFRYLGKSLSGMRTQGELVNYAEQVVKANPDMIHKLGLAGLDDDIARQGISRIQNILREGNLSAVSGRFNNSPTINTRLDELKEEIFRYISQTNAVVGAPGSGQFQGLIAIQQAIGDLARQGVISSAQRIEAQAAGLGTLFNISSFSTFKGAQNTTVNAINAVQQNLANNSQFRSLFSPFAEGEISQVSSMIGRKSGSLGSLLSRSFGKAKYGVDDLSIDPLGASGGSVMVPTFGTAFAQSPGAAIKSVMGFGTYKNPQGFSASSIPMSHAVERLNRYFGTVGLQLNVSNFGGPMDLFARGMIGQRVLPLYAAGTAFMTADRTLGGYLGGQEDPNGERVYSPLITGAVARAGVEASAALSGITPGGMGYEERKDQLLEGEVPIRQGRFWPLGNTPFKGGKVMYYRPSWYRKLQGGAMFTEDTYGSPMEKFLFYNDISPLRPLDPYRFEREHYEDRPYPVTGEYFSGPFGPLTPIMNATLGKILKPQLMMHEEQVAAGLAAYQGVGTSGAYDATAYQQSSSAPVSSMVGSGYSSAAGVVGASMPRGGPANTEGIAAYNTSLVANAGNVRNTAGNLTTNAIASNNIGYVNAAAGPPGGYGPPKVSGIMTPNIVGAGPPIDPASAQYQFGEIGYRMQEMAGIYGFGFASMREALGFGQGDFEHQRAVLQSASKAYGTSRAFWDMNLGGLGDVPLPSREALGNLEFSEIVRRFIPKDRKGIDYLNPIRNTMGQEHPFLPGAEYFTNFQTGDPFTKVAEGEIRLPGIGYERFNTLYSDETGEYGAVSQLDILADVAPYSKQFKTLNRKIDSMDLAAEERVKLGQIREQVDITTRKYEFSDYQYNGSSAEELGMNSTMFQINRAGEAIAHMDNFVTNKVFGRRTAIEDWERRNVYGATFPEWSRPYESYIRPMVDRATQRDPLTATAGLAAIGSLFGRSPRSRLLGTAIGATVGGTSSVIGNVSEAVTGDRYIPKRRKEELALDEYVDILSYVKNTRLASQAQAAGDSRGAVQYRMAAKRTMYGADIYSQDIDTLALALPKRKREHFKSMIAEQDTGNRERILSTAGRLERRIYQAAWGMKVERRPELQDYFERHELPDDNWEGWHPNTNMDHVKIKMGQSMGIQMSQMGYYPQQINQANLANPSYPDFFGQDQPSMIDRLKNLISEMGISGSVQPVMNPFMGEEVNVYAGVR